MSAGVDLRDGAATFVDKWKARWPEWALGMVFVPPAQRPLVEAWMTLLQELGDAAWAGADPTPGLAKLAWWQEELGGWGKGARRHPLGTVLQPQAAPWTALGRALPDLRALRGDEDGAAGTGAPPGAAFAAAVAECEAVLFGGRADAGAHAAMLRALRLERVLLPGAVAAPAGVLAGVDGRSGGRAGNRPRGIALALAAGRQARGGVPLPPLRAVFAAWRGARGAG